MRAAAAGSENVVERGARQRSRRSSPLIVTPLPTASSTVAQVLTNAAQARFRRTLAIAISLLVVGLLQGVVFLTLIEPGRVRLQGVLVAMLVYSAPSLLGWWFARTVSQGQPTELGLWAGIAVGGLSGAGAWVSAASLGSVRVLTAAVAFALAFIGGFIVLLAFAASLRAMQTVARFSSDSVTATLSCVGTALFWFWGVSDRAAGWLLLTAALAFPPTLISLISFLIPRENDQGWDHAYRLLVLRTFGFGKRSNRLLRELARVWLELGPIQLVAGPDLAASVVTLDKVYAWLTGRLRGLFIGSAAEFARASKLLPRRFRDRRFPVQEFSCLASAWRDVVTLLAREADAIVMDLRNFTRSNNGAIFEIQTLIASVQPSRVVFLVDESTDLSVLAEMFQADAEARDDGGWDAAGRKVYRLERDSRSVIRNAVAAAVATLGKREVHSSPVH